MYCCCRILRASGHECLWVSCNAYGVGSQLHWLPEILSVQQMPDLVEQFWCHEVVVHIISISTCKYWRWSFRTSVCNPMGLLWRSSNLWIELWSSWNMVYWFPWPRKRNHFFRGFLHRSWTIGRRQKGRRDVCTGSCFLCYFPAILSAHIYVRQLHLHSVLLMETKSRWRSAHLSTSSQGVSILYCVLR
jgi:hypothetical protein